MAITFKAKVASTLAPHAGALGVVNAAAAVDTKTGIVDSERFALPFQDTGILSDHLNMDNPMAFFSSTLKATPMGGGSVKITFNTYADIFKDKERYTEAGYSDVSLGTEVINWNESKTAKEVIEAIDLRQGVPNVLAERITTRSIKFTQASIKASFVLIEGAKETAPGTAAVGEIPTVAIVTPGAGLSVQEKGAAYLEQFVQEATKLVTRTEYARNDVAIIVDPIVFDSISLAGLIGDKTTVTFSGGSYQVGQIGGYKIMSGSMFLPTNVAGVIGTSDSFLFAVELVAANIGTRGLSNDVGSYLELVSITGLPKRTTAEVGKALMTIITK